MCTSLPRLDYFSAATPIRILLPLIMSLLTSNFALFAEIHELTLDSQFKNLLQETYPLREYGIQEPRFVTKLPDERILLVTKTGFSYVFTGIGWKKTNIKLPAIPSALFTDSKGKMWLGGEGFFGTLDPDFEFHDLSKELFGKEVDSALPVLWIFETGDWIHFANHSSFFQINQKTGERRTLHFEGMFDVYRWMWDGKLYLGTKTNVQVWENDHFEKLIDWPHEHRAYVGWRDSGNYYFLNTTHLTDLYVYNENGKHIETIENNLLKTRGARHQMTSNELIMFTRSGILRISHDGTCQGYYAPWYHKKMNKDDMVDAFYFGGDDLWILTETVLFRLNLNTNAVELDVETGFNISGGWDIETFENSIYVTSQQGFRRWNPSTAEFEFMDENTPDFESGNILKLHDKLVLSTWVRLGYYQKGTYRKLNRDGAYSTFAYDENDQTFWVVKDDGIVQLNENLKILHKIDSNERITSIALYEGEIWATTQDGRLLISEDKYRSALIENPDFQEEINNQKHQSKCLYQLNGRLFLLTEQALWERRNDKFAPVDIPLQEGWNWAVPQWANQDATAVLIQEHSELEGRKIGLLELEEGEGPVSWSPVFVPHRKNRGGLRRVKYLPEIEGRVVAIITNSTVELVDIDSFLEEPAIPSSPSIVSPIEEFTTSYPPPSGITYNYSPGTPLTVKLFCKEQSFMNPVTYFGRLTGEEDWTSNKEGIFSYYGIQRGTKVFEGYVVDAFGNPSGKIYQTIHINPPWYLRNITIVGYVVAIILLIILAVRLQTARLRRQALELEAKIDEKTADLQRANQAKSIFVSNVSHEIRNPLNGLLGLAQTLQVGDIIDEQILRRFKRPSLYLYRFLSNVLDFSKFESGGIRFSDNIFDPSELIDSIESMFSGDFSDRNITFVGDYRFKDQPLVVSSQEAIEIVLVNLVGNAVKYTPEGGMIRLAMLNEEGLLKLSVSDTGVGIGQEDLDRIFLPYERGSHSPLFAGEKGAGIGLSLVYKTVNQMGGSTNVSSEPGNGSVFTCTVPVADPEVEHQQYSLDEVRLKGKYLIVEDLEYNLKFFEDLLKNWGAEVLGTEFGEEAVKIASSNKLDAIFVDYDLPDIDGVEVTRRIRNLAQHRTTPIFGLSAYTDQEYIQNGLRVGMNNYLFKPLNHTKLVECLNRELPENLMFSEKANTPYTTTRPTLNRIRGAFAENTHQNSSHVSEYLETLDELVSELKMSDLCSDHFNSKLHQLEGHCSFINHQKSAKFWKQLNELSRAGERMKLLGKMEKIETIVLSVHQEVAALGALDQDYEQLTTIARSKHPLPTDFRFEQ